MKKYLIVFAAAILALASCTPKEQEGSEYTKISLKQTELALGLGESQKLTLLWEPATLDAPSATWTSSAPEIVSVVNGTVTALDYGEATITVKVGDLSAACQVTVTDPLSLVQWGGFSLWSLDKKNVLSNDTMVVTLRNGQTAHCVMISATYAIWDDNITMDPNTGYMYGTGFFVDLQGTAWLITDSLDKNGANYYYLGTSALQIKDIDTFNWNDTANAYCCVTGKYGDVNQMMEWFNDSTATLDDITELKGGVIDALEWSGNSAKWAGDYIYGFAGTGIFVEYEYEDETTELLYKANFNWFDGDQFLGLVLYQDENEKWQLKEPAEWAPLKSIYYEYLGADEEEEAPKYEAKAPVAWRESFELPRGNHRLPTNVLINK